MATSDARVAANRRNAAKSTGPKTDEGKARSRGNALKHGMTGGGEVVPASDVAEVDALEVELAGEFRSRGAVARMLVRRLAVMAVRLDRCVLHESAAIAQRVRHAPAAWEDQRRAEVAALVAELKTDPAFAGGRLCQTPHGVDWLIEEWTQIRASVETGHRDEDHPERLEDRMAPLFGLRPRDFRVEDFAGLCRTLRGEAGSSPDDAARARDDLLRMIDHELALLADLRAEVDDENEAADRAGAADRALFDPSPEAERARRYEAAAQRAFFRTLRDLKEMDAHARQNEPNPAPLPAPVVAPSPVSRTGGPAPRPPAAPVARAPRPASPPEAVERFPSPPPPSPAGAKTNPTTPTGWDGGSPSHRAAVA